MNYLTVEDVLAITAQVGYQVRDKGLLASVVARASGIRVRRGRVPDARAKTAALIESIDHSRPLVDGNKRLSWFCAVVLLRLNGCDLMVETDDAEQLIVAVAGGTADLPVIAAWIESRAVRFIADPL